MELFIFNNEESSQIFSNGKSSNEKSDNNNVDEAIKECELYMNKHNVKTFLKDCIVQLCHHKPENPIHF
jgi:hypothetical protein